MTLFAVACAGMYPILHLGRPWLFYWLIPYPNTHGMWPNFRSPLDWDVFAISTYALVSLVFWLVGLIPDFATLRDRGVGDLAQITLMSDGTTVYECTSTDEVVDLLQGGQAVFAIAVGRHVRDVEGTLAALPGERATGADSSAAPPTAAADELATRRRRRTTA